MKIVQVKVNPGIIRDGELGEECLDGFTHYSFGEGIAVIENSNSNDDLPWKPSKTFE